MKNIIIGLVSLVVISVACLFYFSNVIVEKQENEDFIQFVPKSAEMVCIVDDLGSVISKKIRTGTMFSDFDHPLMEVFNDSTLNLDLSSITLAFVPGTNDTYDWVFVSPSTDENVSFFEEIFSQEFLKKSQFEIQAEANIAYFYSESFLVFSESENLLKTIVNDDYPAENRSSCQNMIQQDIDANELSDIKFFFSKKALNKVLDKIYSFAPLQSEVIGEWVTLDGKIKSNALLFSGLELSVDSTSKYHTFFDLAPVLNTHAKFLPEKTYSYEWLGGENLQSWLSEYELDSIPHDLVDWIGEEITIANIPTATANKTTAVISVTDSSMAIESLLDFADSTFAFEKIRVLKMKDEQYLGKVLLLENSPKFKYVAYFNGVLLAVNSLDQFDTYLRSHSRNVTLNENSYFESFSDQTYSESNYSIYVNWRESFQTILKSLPKNLRVVMNENQEFWKNYQAWEIQIEKASDGQNFTSGYVKYNPGYKSVPSSVWELKLDAFAQMKPYAFTNHYTQAKEIFIQDTANNIYLVNHNGKLIWQSKVKGAIIGEPEIIDWFGNNKYQLVFVTESHLYCIDRNGKSLKGFPVELSETPLAGVAVFDYKKNNEYRIVFPSEGGAIHNFNKAGKPVTGWEFINEGKEWEYKVIRKEDNGMDYLLSANRQGEMIALNRKGQKRFERALTNVVSSDFVQGNSIEQTLLSGISFNNELNYLNVKNEIETAEFFIDDSLKFFQSENYGNNIGIVNFVKVGDSLLKYDRAGELTASYYWPYPIQDRLNFYSFNQDKFVGLTNQKKNEIVLLNSNLKPFHSFPMVGASSFTILDLNRDGELEVVTCSKDGYLINYLLDN